MSKIVKTDNIASEIMKGLKEYADLSTEGIKKTVKKSGNTVKKEIKANAPKDTGEYAKSWTVKKIKENSNTLKIVVHSKNKYQIAHLLEHGHAKRGGGRVSGKSHIAPAEDKAIKILEEEINKALGGN